MSVKSTRDILKSLDFSKADIKKLSDLFEKEEISTQEFLYEVVYMAKDDMKAALDFIKDTRDITLERNRILDQPSMKIYKEKYIGELLSTMKNRTVNSTVPCRFCGQKEVIATSEQRRSADEEQDIKYKCNNCGNTWYK